MREGMEKNTDLNAFSSNHPSGWNVEQFRTNWFSFLESLVKENGSLVPSRRIRRQIEQDAYFLDIVAGWEGMNSGQRLSAWKRLLMCAEKASQEFLPACVQCGECCRKGSPTLQQDDLEILRSGRIPWNQLVTLKKGEPAFSPFTGKPFYLDEERIKIREKEGTGECVFLDGETDRCGIYADRPLQCRAQACWDPAPSKDLADQPFLRREHLFGNVEVLQEMIQEHDRRCGFDELAKAFEKLRETGGESIGDALRLLSFEEHFRHFVNEQFKVPPDNMELVFGRSLSSLVGLFGFRVVMEPDGTRCLTPEAAKED